MSQGTVTLGPREPRGRLILSPEEASAIRRTTNNRGEEPTQDDVAPPTTRCTAWRFMRGLPEDILLLCR